MTPRVTRRPLFTTVVVTVALAVASSGLVSAVGGPPTRYVMTDLDVLFGKHVTINAINASGQMAGYTLDDDGLSQAVLYSNGSLIEIPRLAGGAENEARGINGAGHVVGWSSTADSIHAFLFDGVVHDLGTLGGNYSEAWAINDAGLIVGQASTTDDAEYHAFVSDGVNPAQDLSTPGTYSLATGINGAGQIVGSSTTIGDSVSHAVLYDHGVTADISALWPDAREAFSINAAGHLIGRAAVGGENHAFIYADGTFTDLSTLFGVPYSVALGINAADQAVGQAATVAGEFAFLVEGGTPVDLNTRLVSNPDVWWLTVATAINDRGQIAVTGELSGQTHTFLLTPLLPAAVTVDDASATYGQTAPLSARLTVSGNPLSGKTVRFLIDNLQVGIGQTGPNGVASFDLPAGRDVATYAINAMFDGDDSAEAGSGGANLTVTPADPGVEWHPETVIPYGRPIGDAQLNATAAVPIGAPQYSLDTGAILTSGTVLGIGRYRVTLTVQPPSPNYQGRVLTEFIEVVKAATSTRVSGWPDPGLTTRPPIFTAFVTTETGIPVSGVVSFFDGQELLGESPLMCDGSQCWATVGGASLSVSEAGHTITAHYGGNDVTTPSDSDPLVQRIRAGAYAIVDLGTLGGSFALPTAISPSGQVVGYGATADESVHGFRSTATGLSDINTLGGTYSSLAAINR